MIMKPNPLDHQIRLINVKNIYKLHQKPINSDNINSNSNNSNNINSSNFKYEISIQPSNLVIGWTSQQNEELIHQDFKESKTFIEILHKFVKNIAPSLNYIQAEAKNRQSGWVPIVDYRAPMALGSRTPDSEDIIGMIRIEENAIIPDSYQSMPVYRLVSSKGFFILPSMELFVGSLSQHH